MKFKVWHGCALLSLIVLIVYYPSLHAGYNSVDDLKMIAGIERSGPLDLERLFVRSKSYYYRPLTILTYTLDRDLWGSTASFMHLGNILLHLANSLLVFAITLRLLPLWGSQRQGPALFAGMLFALHPLASESVAWISGRTDPLMAVFLLLAVWLTIIALQTRRFAAALGAGVSLVLAGLAKEVAVFILPALLWLILVYPGQHRWLGRLRERWWPLLAISAGIAGYFFIRHMAIARDSGVKTALKGVAGGDYDLFDKVRIAFKVYGFYFKKLLVPWPLNFGIVEISDWYVLAGLALAIVLLYLFWRADVPGAFGLMAFCVLSPALLVVFGKMTWTPLAERYLYTSVALCAPLAAWLFIRFRAMMARHARLNLYDLSIAALMLIFFTTTLHRAWVWQDNERLYADTVAKSPNFLAAKAELANSLLLKGQQAEAATILEEMQTDDSPSDYLVDDLNLALVLLNEGEVERARSILLPHLDQKSKKYYDLLQALLRVNDQRIGRVESPEERLAIQQESLEWLKEQQRVKPSAFVLYRTGKMYLAMGDESSALDLFRAALAKAPPDAHYRGAAESLVKRLEGS